MSDIQCSINSMKIQISKYIHNCDYDTKYKIMLLIMVDESYQEKIKTNMKTQSTTIFLDKFDNSTIIEIYKLLN